MRIERDTVVVLECELLDCDGGPLGPGAGPYEYLHGGHGGIFEKVEQALHAMEPGFELKLSLEPEDAYGEYDPQLLRVEPRAQFPEGVGIGMQFEGVPGDGEGGDENLIYTVTDLTPDSVVVDANHPLAGERLWFRAVVRAVRPASSEELAAQSVVEPLVRVAS